MPGVRRRQGQAPYSGGQVVTRAYPRWSRPRRWLRSDGRNNVAGGHPGGDAGREMGAADEGRRISWPGGCSSSGPRASSLRRCLRRAAGEEERANRGVCGARAPMVPAACSTCRDSVVCTAAPTSFRRPHPDDHNRRVDRAAPTPRSRPPHHLRPRRTAPFPDWSAAGGTGRSTAGASQSALTDSSVSDVSRLRFSAQNDQTRRATRMTGNTIVDGGQAPVFAPDAVSDAG